MTFSKSTQIAIKAVGFLAKEVNSSKHYSLKEIAKKIEASEHTLGKTLQLLVKSEVIHSNKGPNGGFYMKPEQVNGTILDISEAIEGKFKFNHCVLGFEKCNSRKPCALHTEFFKARTSFEKLLLKTKIKDLNVKKHSKEKTILN